MMLATSAHLDYLMHAHYASRFSTSGLIGSRPDSQIEYDETFSAPRVITDIGFLSLHFP